MRNECFVCGFPKTKGICTYKECRACPYKGWQQTLREEQQALMGVLGFYGIKAREIRWSKEKTTDTAHGVFSNRKCMIHSLDHYLDTRVVFAFGEHDSFVAYGAFSYGKSNNTPLQDVLPEIRAWLKGQEDYYFTRAEAIFEDIGYNARDQF